MKYETRAVTELIKSTPESFFGGASVKAAFLEAGWSVMHPKVQLMAVMTMTSKEKPFSCEISCVKPDGQRFEQCIEIVSMDPEGFDEVEIEISTYPEWRNMNAIGRRYRKVFILDDTGGCDIEVEVFS
jgi:hypothetical protein